MSAVLQIIGFLCLCALLSLWEKEELVSVTPISAALLILALFVLAFFRALAWIDLLAAAVIVLTAAVFWRRYGKAALRELAELLFAPRALVVWLMLLIAFFLLHGTVISSRDDFGCWAVEAKSILYYGGFAPRYQNAAVSFGTYFPGATLFRCWVCLLAGGFRDGLLAVGSAWMVILLLAPLLSAFSFRGLTAPLVAVLGGCFLLFLPGVADYGAYMSICAEPLLSAAFAGAWLVLLWPERPASKAQLLACGLCLCLFKASGIVYALSILCFCLLYDGHGDKSLLGALKKKELVAGTLLCMLPAADWLLYCRLMARSDYYEIALTAENTAGWQAYLSSLVRGVFTVPAHFMSDGVLDLPLAALALLTVLLFLAAGKLGLTRGLRLRALGVYYGVMLCALLLAVFLMHSFVFREALYLDPGAMIISVSRYGEPLFTAPFLLLLRCAADEERVRLRRASVGAVVLCVLMCSCFWTVYHRVLNSRASIEQASYVQYNVEKMQAAFLAQSRAVPVGRIAFAYGEEELGLYDTERTCLQYLCAPSSVVLCPLSGDPALCEEEARRIEELAAASHADYLYLTALSPELLDALTLAERPRMDTLTPLG